VDAAQNNALNNRARIDFTNCFIYKMHHEFYQLFLHSIFAAFKDIASDQSLEVVLNYIEINRV
jgi:hypothetical protein